MWNGKMKALTFSYDDGVEQDIRLIEILDRYHLRGTFNLNPGLQSPEHTFQKGSVTVRHLPLAQLPEVYKNHEVAGHTNTHLHLEAGYPGTALWQKAAGPGLSLWYL